MKRRDELNEILLQWGCLQVALLLLLQYHSHKHLECGQNPHVQLEGLESIIGLEFGDGDGLANSTRDTTYAKHHCTLRGSLIEWPQAFEHSSTEK